MVPRLHPWWMVSPPPPSMCPHVPTAHLTYRVPATILGDPIPKPPAHIGRSSDSYTDSDTWCWTKKQMHFDSLIKLPDPKRMRRPIPVNIRRYCSFLCTPVLDDCGVLYVSANSTRSPFRRRSGVDEDDTGIGLLYEDVIARSRSPAADRSAGMPRFHCSRMIADSRSEPSATSNFYR